MCDAKMETEFECFCFNHFSSSLMMVGCLWRVLDHSITVNHVQCYLNIYAAPVNWALFRFMALSTYTYLMCLDK